METPRVGPYKLIVSRLCPGAKYFQIDAGQYFGEGWLCEIISLAAVSKSRLFVNVIPWNT